MVSGVEFFDEYAFRAPDAALPVAGVSVVHGRSRTVMRTRTMQVPTQGKLPR